MASRQIYDLSLRVCFFDLWVKIGVILDVQLLGLIEVGVEGCPAHQVVGVLNFELGVHPVRARPCPQCGSGAVFGIEVVEASDVDAGVGIGRGTGAFALYAAQQFRVRGLPRGGFVAVGCIEVSQLRRRENPCT